MVNITNTKSCPYISPPMYKPTKKCLRTNISPGLIFGGLRYYLLTAQGCLKRHKNNIQFTIECSYIECRHFK